MSLFGTSGIRGPVGEAVNPELALRVGRALADDGPEFVVGRDARTTGEGLVDALAAGLESGGANVRRVGVVPTPALGFASQGRHGAMVTASHNPPADNGIKLFADGVEYDTEAEDRIAARIEDAPSPTAWRAWSGGEAVPILAEYRAAVAGYAADHGADPTGLAIAVDGGTGTAGLATPAVLTDLGVRVHALNATPDGHVPARPSKPTPETLGDLRSYVAAADVALGLAHDGDADRIVVVDAEGAIVHEDTILAVLAHHYVSRSPVADPVVVTTPNASGRIDERVGAAGGRVQRVRLGALHEAVTRVQAVDDPETAVAFAAEPWKHLHPAFGGWIDGVVSAAVLARLVAAEGLASLVAPVTERPYRKVSVDCSEDRKASAMARLASSLPETFPQAVVDESHGVRLEFPDGGWALVRPSGTEPKLRIYAERDAVESLVATVRERVEAAAAD